MKLSRLIPALAISNALLFAQAGLTGAAPSPTNGQDPRPDPRALLAESRDAMKQYKTYQLQSVISLEMRGGPFNEKLELPSSVSVRRPDRMRIESSSQAGAITIVGDGRNTWIYLSTVKKYIKRAASQSPEAGVVSPGVLPAKIPNLDQFLKSTKINGEESIDINGVKTPCWIIESSYGEIKLPEQGVTIRDAVQTTWIAKRQHLNLRSRFAAKVELPGVAEPVALTQSTRTTRVKLDLDLPDSIFTFTPPDGAKETADWTLPGITKPDVEGKPAPALHAKTLEGAEVDLTALHGKVVLLHVWATWCEPSRRELADIAKLHDEYRGKDLVVLGVTIGEDQAVVARFVKDAMLRYPVVALDGPEEIVSALSLTSFPTVVLIDREGNVKSYQIGARGEAALRDDLAQLGIGSLL